MFQRYRRFQGINPFKLIALLCFILGCASMDRVSASSEVRVQVETCESSPRLQKEKSAELLKIEREDQADRVGSADVIDWSIVSVRDLARRIKVARIFAEGCFKTAADYGAAAMVFQHGTVSDHFYQTFLWANRAVQLGDESKLWLTAAGIDRYLTSIHQKQLFGTQFSKGPTEISKGVSGKWCLQPIEPSFPERRRIEYIKRSLKENTAHVLKGIGSLQTVDETRECASAFKTSPMGAVPGFW
jgi:hypothetical protein